MVPRAPLPAGSPNYVTRRGLVLLRQERAELESARPDPEGPSGASALAAHHARLSALDARIQSAVVLDPATLPRDEVRFSALVTLQAGSGEQRRYRIVGVDEADARSGRIAFTAPLARELSGKTLGDTVSMRQSTGALELEIVGIDYVQE